MKTSHPQNVAPHETRIEIMRSSMGLCLLILLAAAWGVYVERLIPNETAVYFMRGTMAAIVSTGLLWLGWDLFEAIKRNDT